MKSSTCAEHRYINIEVNKISYHPPSKGYAVLLQEIGGEKQLPIVVGSTEAQSIALAMEEYKYFCIIQKKIQYWLGPPPEVNPRKLR